MSATIYPGKAAVETYGWLQAHKWLLLRRLSQTSIFVLFLLEPMAGIWIIKGNLASSLIFDVLPLSDPFLLLQSLFAGHALETTLMTGTLIVTVFYLLVGGRVYCSWVCPLNMVTDLAARLRGKFKIKGGIHFSRQLRYWVLGMTFIMATVTGTMAWELFSPVSAVQRGIIFGMGSIWIIVMAVFVFDLFISRHGWCGHLCPVGAFYSILAIPSLVRVSAVNRDQCDDCMDCFTVCPEKQVINPALKGQEFNRGPVILSANCTNCGRCIDVCAKEVFKFSHRFKNSSHIPVVGNKEARS
ncbi:MAG: quinol dehydrogenase ferredoxin subunit NapH [Gammaproteobacteria bacterium]|nr:quinol dehydrogenase ferredoxin subunit NapH [Gammaproteobacteria bacterium]